MPTKMNASNIIRGRVTKKIKMTFHAAISLTSFFENRDKMNRNVKNVKKGIYKTIPNKSNKFIDIPNKLITILTGN